MVKKKKKIKMKRLKNLSSCSGLMQTRGETEKQILQVFWSGRLLIISHREKSKSSLKLTVDTIQDIILQFEPPRIDFVLTHPSGLMAGRSPNPTICTPVTGSESLRRTAASRKPL